MPNTRRSSKESHAQLFNRYIWLVDLIYRYKKISFEQISEKWAISPLNNSGEDLPLRTFHNHREAIQQMFSIDICCDKRDGYKYFIENSDDMERGGVRQWLVNTFSVNNLINESHKLKNRILFEQIPSGQRFLTQIIEAMRDVLSLELTYQSFNHNHPATFIVEPYAVKVFRQRWYLIAHSAKNESIAIYALDRIKNLYCTEVQFLLPSDFDAQEYFRDSFGIITSDEYKAEEVKIKAFGNKAKYLETLPLHHSQKELEKGEDYTIFSYYLKPIYDFRQELLSFGAEIQVLSPEWFKNEIKNIVQQQWGYYHP